MAAIIFGAWARLQNLGNLSFWGDDGMTYLGTRGVITYGYPLIPSGFINFHTIFSFYLRAVPALVFGLNEFSLRLPSAVFGILAIPLTFIFVREVLKNKYIALLSSVIVSLSIWQIEFSREVRWYSEFNFFYLASVYFFYLGFIEEKKPFRILFVVFMILVTFINSLGFSLVFLFVFLLLHKGFKGFFRKNIIIPFSMTIAVIAAQTIHRNYWKVGLSFYESTISSNNILLRTLGKFFSSPKAFFMITFKDMFPWMFYVFIFGLLILFLSIFFKKFRNTDEHYLNIFKRRTNSGKEETEPDDNSVRIGLPFNIAFIYFIFFSNAFFLGVGNMYNQQRYIYFAYIYFTVSYCWTIFEISRILSGIIKKNSKAYMRTFFYMLIAAAVFLGTVSHINPYVSAKIPLRENGDAIDSNFAVSNSLSIHPDTEGAGNYIKENIKEGDLVISMDLLNSYLYTQKFDHWVWSGDLLSWQPYHVIGGAYYDYYFGKKVLRDEIYFLEIQGKNLWIHATRSKNVTGHISKNISDYLDAFSGNIVFTGQDGQNIVYYIPVEKAKKELLAFTDTSFSQEEILKVEADVINFDFKADSNRYFRQGWGDAEPEGRWAVSKLSYLFLLFDEKKDYILEIDSKAFFLPDGAQKTYIFINNNFIGEIDYSDSGIRSSSFVIPREFIDENPPSVIKFFFRYAAKPVDVDKNSLDPRDLSVFFSEIVIK